jgi:serine/threonine-protein kinase
MDALDQALDRLLELEPEARARYVDEALADDPDLQARVRAMLGANEEADAMLAAAHREAASLLTEDEEAAAPPLPERIGDYEVLERLGAGGMGTVYLARKVGGALDRHVALKVIGRAGEPDHVRDRFRAEQRILSRLEHPNVARLYEAGVDPQGVPWFVMEYVDLYFSENDEAAPAQYRGIGVRIEDDVLVTKNGRDNLTASIPKTTAEIEAILAAR